MALGSALGRIAADALLGLAVFCLAVGALISNGDARAAQRPAPDAAMYAAGTTLDMAGAAVASTPATTGVEQELPLPPPAAETAVFRHTTPQAAMTVLALVFSLLFSLNLAFWRHLRCQYIVRR